jgi:hypothetical protein
MVGAFAFLVGSSLPPSELGERITRIKPGASLVLVSADIAEGFPLARGIGSTWRGRVCSNWITTSALRLASRGAVSATQAPAVSAAIATDRRFLVEDIRQGKPDLIIFSERDFSWRNWANEDEAFRAVMVDYRFREWVDDRAYSIFERATP